MHILRKTFCRLTVLSAAAALTAVVSQPLLAAGPLANQKSLYNNEPVPAAPSNIDTSDSETDSHGLKKQRRLFQQAKEALAKDDMEAFEDLSDRIQDYPLAPYLHLRELQSRLFSAEADEVAFLLDKYSHIPHSETLRQQWLTHLGRNGEWQTLREHARAPLRGKRLQCLVLRAELLEEDTVNPKALDKAMSELWVTGYSLPQACDPLLSAWRAQGGLTDQLAWQRMKAAAKQQNTGLARYVRRFMSEEFQNRADEFLAVHREPHRLSQHKRFSSQDPLTRELIIHGMDRLIRSEPETAEAIWRQYSESHDFEAQARRSIDRLLGLRLAVRYDERALPWLERAIASAPEPTLYEWHARVHMRSGNWPAVLEVIGSMPDELAQTSTWQYWQARGEEAQGDYVKANARYLEVAENRDFYGFLAADHMGRPYALNKRDFVAESAEVSRMAGKPGIQRARELHHLGRLHHARSEWLQSLSSGDTQALLTAAQLAKQWGWHERAVMATIAAGAWDQLELRFPLAYQERFSESTQQHNVDINWVYAMARQESAFMEDARSSKGALGLLQLLPSTAGATAERHSLAYDGHQSLLDPAVNIPLGTAHLAELLESFQGNRILATAAYNAGEHRVRSWLGNGAESLATDVWLETMPYYETRQYVQNIMAYTIIYSDRRGQRVAGLLTQQELACACIE